MDTLRSYLATLSKPDQIRFARACGTSIGYLRKAICVGHQFDGALVAQLHKHSRGKIKREELRPDIFGKV